MNELFREIASYVELLQSRLIQVDPESSEGADIKVRLLELRGLANRAGERVHPLSAGLSTVWDSMECTA